ncbi:MAG: type II toxin-antitoxin system VapC family toxin [Actinomycetota bacterium]|nr:type II toxin-antitoxin system VapC family toxin [Actinomycetota bacterium]
MNLLLDSHALLWALAGDERIPAAARDAITDSANPVMVSAASVWELSIKQALGRIDIPDDLTDAIQASHFAPLAITLEHAVVAGRLPPLHGDPFDRMLVAQATVERLTVVTVDDRIGQYDVPVLWA